MSAECKAKCDAKVQAHAECTPPHIALRISARPTPQASAKFQAAIEKNLPGVLTVSIGLAKHLGEVAGNMEVVIQGVQGGHHGRRRSDDDGARSRRAWAAPFKGALDAVGEREGERDVSVERAGERVRAAAHAAEVPDRLVK